MTQPPERANQERRCILAIPVRLLALCHVLGRSGKTAYLANVLTAVGVIKKRAGAVPTIVYRVSICLVVRVWNINCAVRY